MIGPGSDKNNCKSATQSLLLSNQYNIPMKGLVGLQLLRVYICLKTRQYIFIRPSPNICLAFEIEMQCVCQVFQWVCIQRKCFNWVSTKGSTRVKRSLWTKKFKICHSLFGWKALKLYKQHIVRVSKHDKVASQLDSPIHHHPNQFGNLTMRNMAFSLKDHRRCYISQ